jgi:hypothetical protein
MLLLIMISKVVSYKKYYGNNTNYETLYYENLPIILLFPLI